MPEAGASTNPKRFMILRCFVDLVPADIDSRRRKQGWHSLNNDPFYYDGRFEILELRLASVSGLNSFFKFRAVP